ncbi:MAG: Uma2 family endonuclease [Oscillospiraceae bacterium]|nr:Uma2 family endonuclease [Oscillospiraceae bacterium]
MPLPMNNIYTAEEYRNINNLPERCELIEGEIVAMSPAPNYMHQRLSGDIFFSIKDYIRRNKGKCQVFAAPADVKLNECTVVQPDIFVTFHPERIDGQYHNGAPEWVIEISSPSTADRDNNEKLRLYKENGVQEYWLVDPERRHTIVYCFGERTSIDFYDFDRIITADIYKDNAERLEICIEEYLE